MIDTYYSVSGMTCGCCASKVEGAVKDLAGVTKASANESEGRLIVTTDTTSDPDAVVAALADAGYEAKQVLPDG